MRDNVRWSIFDHVRWIHQSDAAVDQTEAGASTFPRDSPKFPKTADEMLVEELRQQHVKTESQLGEAAEQYDENRALRSVCVSMASKIQALEPDGLQRSIGLERMSHTPEVQTAHVHGKKERRAVEDIGRLREVEVSAFTMNSNAQ